MERRLVELAMRGDEEAFDMLVGGIGDGLHSVARRILRDTTLAQDATQEALLDAWRYLPTLRDPDRFEAWVHRLLVNACHAEGRRERLAGLVRPSATQTRPAMPPQDSTVVRLRARSGRNT